MDGVSEHFMPFLNLLQPTDTPSYEDAISIYKKILFPNYLFRPGISSIFPDSLLIIVVVIIVLVIVVVVIFVNPL